MSQHRPRDIAIFQLANADLASESTVGFIKDVLGRDFDTLLQVLAGEEEVEGWRGDDDFGVGVAFGVVEVGDDFFDCGDVAVPVSY